MNSGYLGSGRLHHFWMTTSSPLDPAVTRALVDLGNQRLRLDAVLERLDIAQQLELPSSPHSWIGVASRAHTAALADLRTTMQTARSTLERARVNTSTAIDELNARV